MTKESKSSKSHPARNPEGRLNQLISLAFDLAEKQLREGTASSQVITQFLKLADPKEKLERDILVENKKLVVARTASLESAAKTEELYQQAINAMKSYSSGGDDDVED